MLKNLCQIGMDMPRNSWWRWAIGGLLGLLLLTLLTRCGSIQDDIQARTQGALNSSGMGWANADLQGNGRDVVLTGVAPSESARDEAINTAQSVYGARVVDHDISIKQYVSSEFNLSRDGDKVTLSGTLPNQETIDSTVSEVQGIYGADNVTNNLVASDSASMPKWLAGATALLPGLAAARNLVIDADDNAVNISGDVETEELRTQAMSLIGDTAKASLAVVKTGPSAEELAAIAAAKAAADAKLAQEKARLEAEEQARLAAEEAARLKAAEDAKIALAKAKAAAEEAERLAKERAAAKARAEAAAKAEQERLAALQHRYQNTQKHLSNQARQMVMNCELDMNRLVAANVPPFIKDSAVIHRSGYGLLGLITMQIEICSDLLRHNNLHIDVSTKAIDGEGFAEDSGISEKRTETVINYLQHINGVYPGLLRINSKSDDKHTGNTQLHFTITQ